MGKLTIILVIGLMMFVGVSSMNFNRVGVEAVANSGDYYSDGVARNLSRSVLEYYSMRLAANPTLNGTFTETDKYFIGSYDTVTVTPAGGDTVNILIKSRFGQSLHELSATLVVDATVEWPYAIFGANDVTFNAGGNITGDVHANNIIDNTGGVSISGTTSSGSPLSAPAVNWTFYENEAIAAGQRVVGDMTFTGASYTGVWYITGTATIGANTDLDGTIVAANDIIINSATNVSLRALPQNYPTLLSGNTITATVTADITGFRGLMYGTNDIIIGGEFDGRGALATGVNIGTITTNDVFNLIYDAVYTTGNPGMTFGISASDTLVTLIRYFE